MCSATSDKRHILVVDDDLPTREVLRVLLRSEGFDVATAGDGAAALEQLRLGERPGLILLDLMMPVMDGWQFRREQQRDSRLVDIPVIVCSAARRTDAHAPGLHALAYLDKPVDPRELLRVVRRFYPASGSNHL